MKPEDAMEGGVSAREIASRFAGHRSASFDASIARANQWALTLFGALDEAGLAPCIHDLGWTVDLFDFDPEDDETPLASVPAIRRVAPVEADTLAAIENDFGPLPPSYRALLEQCGRLDFLSTAGCRLKMLAGASQRESVEELSWLLGQPTQWSNEESPRWSERTLGCLGSPLHSEEAIDARFLPVLEVDQESQVMLALHLRNKDGESPFLVFDWMDEIYFDLEGKNAREWLDVSVDRMIREFTDMLVGKVLSR